MPPSRVIVVGAGPAGLMAAGQAAARGAETLLLERMERPGRKLIITGRGRCNLTNSSPLAEFIPHFGRQGDFLRQAFHRFFSDDLIGFLTDRGVATVTERGGRVFPASQAAGEVARAMVRWVEECGAVIRTHSRVTRLRIEGGRVMGVHLGAAGVERADAVVLATGGISYPETGSTGDGQRLAAAAGHAIEPLRPALVPLVTAGDTARRLQGLSLRNVRAGLRLDGRRGAEEFGEMLFTHFGVSGPIVLTLSGRAVDALRAGSEVALAIDLKPGLDERQLDARLQRDLQAAGRRRFATILKELLPRKLIPVCADLTGIATEMPGHQIDAAQRRRLGRWLKDFRLPVTGHRPPAEAIITAGGVSLREVDPRTLESRIVPGLHFAGEILDLQADTGGYNLQAAFSTGWLAGRAAAGVRENAD
ncbi:MAG: NAD(P)/FAD-dependent oxidoreductase [Candidatus Eisenbacteria bacterium]|uniref:NAD(P)/FAD-dependent oxidoreductase n=1 Tax=Eiseniibacteriota bacterium TaxID=2212470 RepID=A0A938BQ27_UNCEI|nr:NAD(P)/FAD-dependent oxidoreductase [Candidatus Eisenbacteria bacterium]